MNNIKISDLEGKAKEFAEACYGMNSIEELKDAFDVDADKTDMKEWSITANEWRLAVQAAHNELVEDLIEKK